MILRSKNGESLEVKIVGYEFPDRLPSPNDEQQSDCNWLVVETRFRETDQDLIFTSPCMLTYDAERLYKWLLEIEQGTAKLVIGGLEPNISFRLLAVGDSKASLEFEYMYHKSIRERWQHYVVPLELTFDDLKRAAAEWRAEIQCFPVRYARSTLNDDSE